MDSYVTSLSFFVGAMFGGLFGILLYQVIPYVLFELSRRARSRNPKDNLLGSASGPLANLFRIIAVAMSVFGVGCLGMDQKLGVEHADGYLQLGHLLGMSSTYIVLYLYSLIFGKKKVTEVLAKHLDDIELVALLLRQKFEADVDASAAALGLAGRREFNRICLTASKKLKPHELEINQLRKKNPE